ncbi:MAG: hypothetical protein KDC46_09335 [Thermoleophilia bacterium]|nr:hypothetical protein [Thermoleophilia bacterium]
MLSEQFQGLDRSKDVQQNATFVSYSMLNQVQASTTREYSSGVRACTKGPRARNTKFSATTLSAMRGCPYGWLRAKATKAEKKLARTTQRGTRIVLVLEHAGSVSGEVAMYDPLGRQFQSVLTVDDDPRDGAQSISHVERRYFTGEAQDPFSEVALGGDGVGTRWVLRGPTGLIGELRDTQTRYSVTDQQGSPRLSLDGSSNSLLKATYDYDTFGSAYERDNELSLASGTADEFEQAAYGYTGMRQRDSAATTNHHARDYNADLRSWLQTDQYMDPWSDVGMPRVEWTRLISLSR